ncbi:FKBP-type peptidyl-prolyl cis-trans isomerase [Thermaurantiacus sp.]
MTAGAPEPAPSGLGAWLVAGVIALAAMVGLAFWGTRGVAGPAAAVAEALQANRARPGVVETPSGLQYEVVAPGKGRSPGPTDLVLVHYEGRLADGTVFDSSYARGQPAVFAVSDVIPGWSEALQLMRPGAKYRLVIPPGLAYGARGAGGVIPPNAVLFFDVELLQTASR